MYFDGSLRL
jgi:ribonuclease HI